MKREIRVLALAVIQRRDGAFLLERGRDAVKEEVFYRPMGGGVEFCEKGEEAVVREFREEIGRDIVVESLLGTVENIFEWQGAPGHQVVFFYKCGFADAACYRLDRIPRTDGNPEPAHWRSLDEIEAEGAKLYPAGIGALLRRKA